MRIGDNDLAPVSVADAFGSGIDPRGAWYDEMLISGNTIVVIGYSYARGGTEIGLFEISRAGRLAYRATYHLRSNDYYSSRNYASRLIGSKLVFYTPLYLNPWGGDPLALVSRRCAAGSPGATPAEFKRIAPATRIYRTDEELDPYQGVALHTVTVCDLAQAELECESTAVLGPPGRVFYVSAARCTSGRRRAAGAGPRAGAGLGAVPHSARRRRAERAQGRGQPDRPVLVPRGRGRHLNVLVRAQRPRRRHVGGGGERGRFRAAARAARELLRRPGQLRRRASY